MLTSLLSTNSYTAVIYMSGGNIIRGHGALQGRRIGPLSSGVSESDSREEHDVSSEVCFNAPLTGNMLEMRNGDGDVS